MKEPKHPVGPAFEHSRESEEAWRQQQIAALTQEQRREYDRRVQDEQKKLEAEKRRIESQKPRRVEAEKQNLLSGKPAPHLRMFQSRPMRHKKAEELAKLTVEQKSNAEIERADKDARERLNGHLRHAERERAKHKQQEQTTSRDKTQNRGNTALARAFQKAERQQQQSRQRTHVQAAQEQGRDRERGRN